MNRWLWTSPEMSPRCASRWSRIYEHGSSRSSARHRRGSGSWSRNPLTEDASAGATGSPSLPWMSSATRSSGRSRQGRSLCIQGTLGLLATLRSTPIHDRPVDNARFLRATFIPETPRSKSSPFIPAAVPFIAGFANQRPTSARFDRLGSGRVPLQHMDVSQRHPSAGDAPPSSRGQVRDGVCVTTSEARGDWASGDHRNHRQRTLTWPSSPPHRARSLAAVRWRGRSLLLDTGMSARFADNASVLGIEIDYVKSMDSPNTGTDTGLPMRLAISSASDLEASASPWTTTTWAGRFGPESSHATS